MNITIDPDDTVIRGAIDYALKMKDEYIKADKAWDRSETSAFLYCNAYDKWTDAKGRYERSLTTLGLLFLERL